VEGKEVWERSRPPEFLPMLRLPYCALRKLLLRVLNDEFVAGLFGLWRSCNIVAINQSLRQTFCFVFVLVNENITSP